ncbi:MAG: DUF4249 family protein, partial [Candidatus Eisenbacteria bacterium]|nr:DUF4249 family protein [Candidatus Eisenbacteria bacterium]
MTKSLAITCAGILAVCLLGSCSTERDPRDLLAPGGIGVPVIDALLVVGQPLPDIFLTRTIAPDETFNTTRALIARAHVVVTDVAAGTDVIYGYSETTGRYIAPTSPFPTLVEPNTEYRIAITTQEGETLTASTVTPPSLAVADWLLLDDQGQSTRRTLRGFGDFESSDSVYIAPENQIVYGSGILEARLARPDVPAFQIGLHSLDLDSDFVIDPDFFDEEDFEDLDRVTSSP